MLGLKPCGFSSEEPHTSVRILRSPMLGLKHSKKEELPQCNERQNFKKPDAGIETLLSPTARHTTAMSEF